MLAGGLHRQYSNGPHGAAVTGSPVASPNSGQVPHNFKRRSRGLTASGAFFLCLLPDSDSGIRVRAGQAIIGELVGVSLAVPACKNIRGGFAERGVGAIVGD